MVGFLQQKGSSSSLAQHKVTCFHGVQSTHYDIEHTKTFDNGKVKYNKITKTNDIQPVNLLTTQKESAKTNVSQKKTMIKTSKRRNLHLEHKPSDEMDILISEINDSDLGWKADTCKY